MKTVGKDKRVKKTIKLYLQVIKHSKTFLFQELDHHCNNVIIFFNFIKKFEGKKRDKFCVLTWPF